MTKRYDLVTETTGIKVTDEAASMLATRYELAAKHASGRRVLELGCGAGLGFGLLGAAASNLVGGDYSTELLESARRHYGGRYPFVRLSADQLPFRDAAFDLIVCFEMTYYLTDASRAFSEMHRVLSADGRILIVNANPERPDFIRSPFSVHYHSGDEFRSAFAKIGMTVDVEGAYPLADGSASLASRALVIVRQLLERLRLVPRTIEGRARLKALLYRSLRTLPPEIPPGFAPTATRTLLAPGPARGFKVIYVSAAKRAKRAA